MSTPKKRQEIEQQIRAMQAQGLITAEQAEAMLAAALGEQATYDAKVQVPGAAAQGPGAKAVGQGGVMIEGDVSGSTIITGNNNQVKH